MHLCSSGRSSAGDSNISCAMNTANIGENTIATTESITNSMANITDNNKEAMYEPTDFKKFFIISLSK